MSTDTSSMKIPHHRDGIESDVLPADCRRDATNGARKVPSEFDDCDLDRSVRSFRSKRDAEPKLPPPKSLRRGDRTGTWSPQYASPISGESRCDYVLKFRDRGNAARCHRTRSAPDTENSFVRKGWLNGRFSVPWSDQEVFVRPCLAARSVLGIKQIPVIERMLDLRLCFGMQICPLSRPGYPHK
jgi:hypothetical protein